MNFLKKILSLFLSWLLFLFTFSVNLKASPGFGEQGLRSSSMDKQRIAVLDLDATDNKVLKNVGYEKKGKSSVELVREAGKLLGGSVLSYLVIKGLITIVSQYDRGKVKKPEIGLPPPFPELPPRP